MLTWVLTKKNRQHPWAPIQALPQAARPCAHPKRSPRSVLLVACNSAARQPHARPTQGYFLYLGTSRRPPGPRAQLFKNKAEPPPPPRRPARRLAVSSCHVAGYMGVVAGRVLGGGWCSAKRRLRMVAPPAKKRGRSKNVVAKRALSTAVRVPFLVLSLVNGQRFAAPACVACVACVTRALRASRVPREPELDRAVRR